MLFISMRWLHWDVIEGALNLRCHHHAMTPVHTGTTPNAKGLLLMISASFIKVTEWIRHTTCVSLC